MIDRQYCQEQLARLSGLPGYPKNDDGKRSLIDAFQGAFGFAGKDALRRWIDETLRYADRCPLPRDAYRRGSEVTPEKAQAKTRCFLCYDTGQTVGEFLVTWRGGQQYSQRLTAEQAADLRKKEHETEKRGDRAAMFGPGKQGIYEGPVRCGCQREERMPPAPEERDRYERKEPGGAA